jgi:hypothetical protein
MAEQRFSITGLGCTDAYTEEEIDFLAVYLVPLVRDPGEGFCAEEVSAVLSPRTRVRWGSMRNIGKRGG